jgi:hypothetical protein
MDVYYLCNNHWLLTTCSPENLHLITKAREPLILHNNNSWKNYCYFNYLHWGCNIGNNIYTLVVVLVVPLLHCRCGGVGVAAVANGMVVVVPQSPWLVLWWCWWGALPSPLCWCWWYWRCRCGGVGVAAVAAVVVVVVVLVVVLVVLPLLPWLLQWGCCHRCCHGGAAAGGAAGAAAAPAAVVVGCCRAGAAAPTAVVVVVVVLLPLPLCSPLPAIATVLVLAIVVVVTWFSGMYPL